VGRRVYKGVIIVIFGPYLMSKLQPHLERRDHCDEHAMVQKVFDATADIMSMAVLRDRFCSIANSAFVP